MGFLDRFKRQKEKDVQKFISRETEYPKTKEASHKSIIGTKCPYCNAPLNPVPQRKKKCPSCGKFIFVRTRPSDRQRVLVTEEGAKRIDEEETAAIQKEMAANRQASLASYKESGVVEKVEVYPALDDYLCPVCKAAAGVYPIDKAPSLPISGCTSDMGCRCCYLPVID